MLSGGALFPREAHAHSGSIHTVLGVDIGWEDMLLGSRAYSVSNHGFMLTLALGLEGVGVPGLPSVGMDWTGIQLEQDLGFIDVRHKWASSGDKRFKGATLAGFNGHLFLHHNPDIMFSSKLGLGAVYIQAPVNAEQSLQAWFAVRPSVGLNFQIVSIFVGLELDYTLGLSRPNVFDNSRAVHFVSMKLKVWI